ncbi:hypothetical protein IKE98_01785 [Candidatus Saccharibacteria bacterium]|nr:hypothetical protein [Candidatus Saccharibacteria bacterium]
MHTKYITKNGILMIRVYNEGEEQDMMVPEFLMVYDEAMLPDLESHCGDIVLKAPTPSTNSVLQVENVMRYRAAIDRLVKFSKSGLANRQGYIKAINKWAEALGLPKLDDAEVHRLAVFMGRPNFKRSFKARVEKYLDHGQLVSVKQMLAEIEASYEKRGHPLKIFGDRMNPREKQLWR